MYLKSIEIVGFKSFADKTRIDLRQGIIGVVGPNGCGKCVTGDTLVQLADGSLRAIGPWVEERIAAAGSEVETWDDGFCARPDSDDARILSLNPATLRVEARPVRGFVKRKSPEKLLRIRTRSGREVTATHYHPLFTLDDGRLREMKAEELRPGMPLALPRRLPVAASPVVLDAPGILELLREDRVYVPERGRFNATRKSPQSARVAELLDQGPAALVGVRRLRSSRGGEIALPAQLDEDLARFLGLLISEGRTTRSNQVWFVNSDPAVIKEFCRTARAAFGAEVFEGSYKPGTKDCLIFSKTLCLYLDRVFGLKIEGKSAVKAVPEMIFRSPESVVTAFLSGLYEGDGCLRLDRTRERTAAHWEYTTASRTLAEGVATLLLRLGIVPLIRRKMKAAMNTVAKTRRPYWSVYVYGLENCQRLGRLLEFSGAKRAAVAELLGMSGAANPNLDLVPGVTGRIRAMVKESGLQVKPLRREHPKLAAYCEGRCEPSRAGLAETATLLRAAPAAAAVGEGIERLETLSSSDVYWDAIESVEPVPGPEWVYDLSVAETHNFVANGLFVHNSNITESVRWCIGEMSWKSLRSTSMVNVIFAGTARRPALSLCEVTLTFDNAQSLLPVQYSEVSVTRRLYRSGESEYWMNKTQCRLRDIRELFLDTGIGSDGYAIIDQGGVDFVLKAKPEERRALFEEAAGVSKYKAKREEASRKLERVAIDLARLCDNLSLINEQIKKLDSDARKAKLYQKYKEELAGLEAASVLAELGALEGELAAEAERTRPLAESLAALDAALSAEEAALSAAILERSAHQDAVLESNNRLGAVKSSVARLESAIEFARKTQAQLAARREESLRLAETEAAELAAKEPELLAAREAAEAAAAEAEKARGDEAAFLEDARRIEDELAARAAELEALRGRALQARQEALEASRRNSKAESDLGRLEIEARAALRELEKLDVRSEGARAELERLRGDCEVQRAAALEARRVVEGKAAERAELAAGSARLGEETLRVREELARASARLEAFKTHMARDPYWTGARALADCGLPGVVGTVGSLLEYEDSWRSFVEDALGDRLYAVVCRDHEAARAAIDYLRQSGSGRARILVESALPERAPGALALPPGARPLAGHVRCPGHERVLAALAAEAYALEGALHGGHWVCGGAAAGEGSEVRLGDLAPMEAQAAALSEQSARLQAERAALDERLRAAEGEALAAAAANDLERGRLQALDAERSQREASLGLALQEAGGLERQAAGLLADAALVKEDLLRLGAELAARREAEGALEGQAAEAAGSMGALRERAAGASARRDGWAQTLRQIEGRAAAVSARLDGILSARDALSAQLGRRAAERDSWERERADSVESERLSAAESGGLREQLAALENEAAGLFRKQQEIDARSNALADAIRLKKGEADVLREALHGSEVKVLQARARSGFLTGRLLEQWQLTWEEAKARFAGVEAEEGKIQFLRRRIEALGNVNMAAPEEYEELRQRRDVLQAQIEDLSKAKLDLESAIQKINATTREHFRQTFTEVREHFRTLYGVLFEGGEADLVLTDGENLLEAGVDIVAQPPGKKLQSISLLSGGEKTLTAIALLFAFFMVKPSPICMLDEADAALDDANVDRFVSLLKQFADRTQFLIVSHNKKTMEACDVIYGITMEESGVSQVISVDFEKRAAEQPRPAAADESAPAAA